MESNMKINNKELKILYKVHLAEKKPLSRKDCPSPKEIIKFVRFETSNKKKEKILDHLLNCSFCAKEFEFILEILRYEKKLNQEIDKFMEKSFTKKRNEKKISKSKKIRLPFYAQIRWKNVSIAAGSIVLFFLIIAPFIFKNHEKHEYRGGTPFEIMVIQPTGKIYTKSSLVFKWENMSNSDYFILEIFDNALNPIFKSNKIYKNQSILPDKIIKMLSGKKTYFWMVTAFFSNGEKIESRLEEFAMAE